MMNRRSWITLAVVAALVLVIVGNASALVINLPQPITRRVTVQLIQTALDNGTSPATVFGNAAQRASIEASIDAIWAQAGIEVDILPPITRYNNTFAYQGNAGAGVRPEDDLTTIFNNAANSGGILNADTRVLKLFLVNVVPKFSPLTEWQVAGLANVGRANPSGHIGIAGYVGDNLLSTQANLDIVAGVVAHEIGHNLGLEHITSSSANLMYGGAGTSQQLTSTQISSALSSNYSRVFTTPISGDYNANGRVDAADYVVWRNSMNQTGSGLAADGNSSGVVDSVDFSVWRGHHNYSRGIGGAGTGFDTLDTSGAVIVPEPSTLILLLCALPWLLPRTARIVAHQR